MLARLGVIAASTATAVGGIDTVLPADSSDLKKTVIGLVSAIVVHVLFSLYKKIVKKKDKDDDSDTDLGIA